MHEKTGQLFDPNDYATENDLPQYHKPPTGDDIDGVLMADITSGEIRTNNSLGGDTTEEYSDNLIREAINEIFDIYKRKDEKKDFFERMSLITRFFELENLLKYSEKNLNDYFKRNTEHSLEELNKIREELKNTRSIS